MDKKTAHEIKQHFKEEFREGDREEKRSQQTNDAFDELYKGQSYVVKERSGCYKLKPLPRSTPKNPPIHFQPGDRVENRQGKLLTVLVHLENLVIVKEEANNYHPDDLTLIEHAQDTYQV